MRTEFYRAGAFFRIETFRIPYYSLLLHARKINYFLWLK